MNILISGGGTGGHIFPALSIANAIKRRMPDADIRFVGAEGRMEMERVPAAGYPIIGLPVAGFDRKHLWHNIPVLFKLWRSLRMARRIVREFKPDIAVGVGGYASGPTLKAAQRKHIPTLLQEQNSYAGVTNKLLAAHAGKICVAYDGMERFFPADKIVKTGNPVRDNLLHCTLSRREAKQRLGFDPDRPLVVSFGGSLGAQSVNESITLALPMLAQHDIQLLWQTGKLYFDRCHPVAEKYSGAKAMAFVTDMDVAYRAADLVIARAGAGTISELQLLGVPAVLIPSPNVAEDHQRKNALALASVGAAVMLPDDEAPEALGRTIVRLINDPDLLARLGDNVASMALRDSDEKIVDEIIKLARNE